MDSRAINRVERVLSELKRGQPVIVKAGGTGNFLLALAENIQAGSLKFLHENASDVSLLLTQSRMAVLSPDSVTKGVLKIPLSRNVPIENMHGVVCGEGGDYPDWIKGEVATEAESAMLALPTWIEYVPAVLCAKLSVDADAFAKAHDLLAVSQEELTYYRDHFEGSLTLAASAPLTLAHAAQAHIHAFRAANGLKEHYAIVIGTPNKAAPLVRVHSSCYTGDLLASLKCDCRDQLHDAIKIMGEGEGGILLYLMQEGRGIGLINKLRTYAMQNKGLDTVDANRFFGFEDDARMFMPAAEMLKQLGFNHIRLLTNNPKKVEEMERCGIKVSERVSHIMEANEHNDAYLATKAQRMRHEMKS